ncbi:MAG: CHAT domain-containing protein [Chloroflexota bacterium]|nr:CHAT domain-containing protein [Chloroflexota bacterium]
MNDGDVPARSDDGTRQPAELFAELERLVVADPPAGLSFALSSFDLIDANGVTEERIRLRRLLAMAYAHTNQFETSLETCEEAVALGSDGSAPVEVARAEAASMQPLAMLDRVDEAIAAGQRALRFLETHEDGRLAGPAALNIGAIYAMTGRPAEALPYFDQARRHGSKDTVLLGQVETNRGTALAALDQFQAAEVAFGHAARLLAIGDMPWAAAIAEGNLADLAARQGAINRSLRHFEASRRHLERDEAFGDLGRLNAEEAAVLAGSGLTAVAREAFVAAIALLTEHGTCGDLAMARIAYAAALVDAGDLDKAETALASIDDLIDAGEHDDLDRQVIALRARLAIARGDRVEAARLVEQGHTGTADRPIQQVRWTLLRAELARGNGDGDLASARTMLEEALAVAESARITPLVAELREVLAGIARESGDDEVADGHARIAIEAFESIRGTIQADRLRQSWHRERLGAYGDLYRSLLARADRESQAEAFGLAERIRSRTLLDAMHVQGGDVERDAPVSEAERPLHDELVDHRRWLNWMFSQLADGHEPNPAQVQELGERERAAANLADRLATLRPPSGFDAPLPLDRVQAGLTDADVILGYLAVGETLTVQLITAGAVHGLPDLAPVDAVCDLVARVQFQIGRAVANGGTGVSEARQARLRRDMDTALADLHQVLIEPLEGWLDGKSRAVVVPSGDLHGVPFAALLGETGYLVDRLATATAPGISILANMTVPETIAFPPSRPLVAGVPDDVAPGLEDEARFVAGSLPGATLLLGDAATCEAALAAMPVSDLVHLACHGRFDADHTTASGLRLADGWLTLDRLADVRLDGALVLLTGCETGRVRVDQGDELVGMMAALVAAGAGGLVTSLWKTHDVAATALMTALYDRLANGADPLTALRDSQRMVRERFPHPAWWAPFAGVHAGPKG